MAAYASVNSIPMQALPTTIGVIQTFLVDETNAGASTFSPDGLQAAPILGLGGEPLQGNELVLGGAATLVSFIGPPLNSGNLCWILLTCTGGAQQVGTGVGSDQSSTIGQVQTGALITAVAAGDPNALTATIPSTLSVLVDGQPAVIIAAAANTAAATLVLTLGETALTALPIVKGNKQPLNPGDIPRAGYPIELNFSATLGAFVMQNPVTGIGNPIAVVGAQRNLKAKPSTGTSITYTADQIVVATSLDGVSTLLANFNQAFDGTKTGLGGMDTGAQPKSSFVAFYAALTDDGDAAIFGTVASSVVGEVYGGMNLPEGVIATALIGVWLTDAAGNLTLGSQRGRRVSVGSIPLLSTSTVTGHGVFSPFSVAAVVPANAVSISGTLAVQSPGSSSTATIAVVNTVGGDGQILSAFNTGSESACNFFMEFDTPQMLLFSTTNLVGTATYTVLASSYSF